MKDKIREKIKIYYYSNQLFGVIFIFLSIVIAALIILNAVYQTGWSSVIKFDVANHVSALIASVFSFLTVLLLWLTLNSQIQVSRRTDIENHVFSGIQYHREIVNQLFLEKASDGVNFKGKRVFERIYDEIRGSTRYVKQFIENKNFHLKQILKEEALNQLQSNEIISSRKIDLLELEILNISYLIVFYGLKQEGVDPLIQILKKRHTNELIDELLNELNESFSYWSEKKDFNADRWFFVGKQHMLGDYFRQLYGAVNYVDTQKDLPSERKYEYVKMLRAHLTNYEQAVIFHNSISILGRSWELNPKNKKNNTPLISRYNLIKNIPPGFIEEVDIKKYYPKVEWEV